jgi:hypothetical protein
MMRSSSISLLTSALLAAAQAQAAPPARVELHSDILRNGTAVAEMVDRFEHADGRYSLSQVWRGKGIFALRGSVKRRSHGTASAAGLKPLEFTDERTGRPTARATFDWQANTLTMQYRGGPRTEPMPERAHDRLAFLFDFVFGAPPEKQVSFHLADGRGMSHQVYEINGRERLRTPAGEFDTVKMVRSKDGDRTEVWLAADLSYLPVRVLVVDEDGTRVEQIVTRISMP